MSALGLYRLLTPHFLAGFTFPDEADAYLSKLGVKDLTAIYDSTASVLTGTLVFGDAPREHAPNTGKGGFRWDDIEVRFRLVVPRDGAGFINTAAHNGTVSLAPLAGLLDRFLPVDQTVTTATEYPGVRFRLELLLDELHFELSDDWKPGKLNADHRIVRDASIPGPTRIVLPKAVLAYEQTDDFQSPPSFSIVSWGGGGFDAPTELLAGELVRMEPPIAAHRDGRVGFGLGAVVVDLDPNNTPLEILQFFGTDESFQGIYVQSARLYYADEGKDLAINASVKDLLISFAGEVSFDASVDLIGPERTLSAALVVIDQGKNVPVSPGKKQPAPSSLISGGKVKTTTAAQIQVDVIGGVPPITISVKADLGAERYDATTGTVNISTLTPGEHTLALHVQDSAPGTDAQSYDEDVELTLVAAPAATAVAGAPADRPAQPGDLPQITASGGTSGTHGIAHDGTVQGTVERFRVFGAGTPTVTANGQPVTVTGGVFQRDVPENTVNLALAANWPAITTPQALPFKLFFARSWPRLPDWPNVKNQYLADTVADGIYEGSRAPGQTEGGTAALHAWIGQIASGGATPSVTVHAHASFERADQQEEDQWLSERRLEVGVAAIGNLATVTAQVAHGHTDARFPAPQPGTPPRTNNPTDRVAIVTASITQLAATATLTVSRGARPQPQPEVVKKPTPPPKPLPNKPPDVFRRIGIRVKIIRNDLVLIELTGQLDFETGLEKSLRNPSGAPALPAGGSLGLKQKPAAVSGPNPNPKDGVVDFRLTVVHDPATHSWTETLAIGAHPDDVDGLLQMTNVHSGALTTENRLKDLLGSVLILSPIIGTAVGALDPNSAGSYAVLGGALVGAAAVGAAGFVRTSKITLYGGELRFRQVIPPDDPAQFTDAGVVFDYGVEFGVEIDALDIKTTKPLKVRYRALGFNLNFAGGGYQPIFDTSKGYELDLSDPGLFALPSPIDNVLKIFGARIAKVNPLTVELDLGMKVDLGVITIDRFKVKLPIEPPGVPTILPSGIKVDIAKVLLGSGYVNIIEPPAAPAGQEQPGFGGIEGCFDVTLVPIKLRIAASFGVRPVSQGIRHATAVFLGLIIDLPAPIPLGGSGIGIYGFSGLFAMHYKRIESDPDPTDAIGPAILWLKAAGGEPAKLFNNGVTLWDAELDRWSFGVGLSLGTMEGGVLVNLRGMFVLELPGPRILIFVKILIIKALPDLKPATDLTVGILGVIDLDFARHSFTIGIIVNLEIKEIVSVVVPVELFTKLDDLNNWHLYVGTFGAPASAMVLNIVRGFGYVMIAGHEITGWPGYGQTRNLPGIAMAAGIGASIVFGDEGIGLYLKVSARADVAVTFSPKLFLVGRVQLDGELRLFIVSVGAHGRLDVEAPDPTHLKGEICGHVDLFFFSVEGCVKVEIGSKPPLPPPPTIVRNVWLQSHAPVITAGQGGDRPIDASLGDARPGTVGTGPIVPIDAIPVIQFQAPPTVDAPVSTFTEPLVTAPGMRPGGWISLGGSRRVTYALKAVRLDGPPPGPGTPKATWRPDPATSATGGKTSIDLALLSNVPMMGARAMERSADLNAVIDGIWGKVCDPIAPAASVLWTFCGQPLGPSGSGWELTGHAWPDPPGTVRDVPVDVVLRVDEPVRPASEVLLDAVLGHTAAGRIDPAKVIGPNSPPDDPGPGDPGDPGGPRSCLVVADRIKDRDVNPSLVAKTFRATVFNFNGMPYPTLRISGIGQVRGLDVGFRTELALLQPATEVTLTLATFARPALLTAYEADGSLAMKATMSGPRRAPEIVVLTGKALARVVIEAPSDETLLIEVCVRVRPRVAIRTPVRLPVFTPTATAVPNTTCMRALQLPEQRRPGGKGDVELTAKLKAAAGQQTDDRWIDLVTGPLQHARLYLAVAKRLFGSDSVVVEQLDGSGAIVTVDPLSALAPVLVTAPTSGLPAAWTDPAGPWRAEVDPVATFLADPALAQLVHVWVTIVATPKTDRLRIRVQGRAAALEHPAVVLAVAEVLTTTEGERAATEEASRSGQVETLAGYLNGSAAVPLLTPGRAYTLHVDYVPKTEDTNPDGTKTNTTFSQVTESFRFSTDANPPARLDAYVLATNPRHEEQFVFADDTVEIVFNDLQVVQMYKTYGRDLTAVLRGADGVAIPPHQVADISEVPATYTSPLYDSLDAKVKGGAFKCIGPYHQEGHAKFTLPEPLRPSMAYTLDIEAVPVPAPPADKAIVPLFRRQFRTGRFRTLAGLVAEMQARPLEHRMLTGPITGLSFGAATDLAIENALLAAGLQALGAPTQGSRIVLWRPAAGGRYVPHAVLLDASEPLWRFRDAPKQEVVPGQPDNAFQRIVPGEETSLKLEAAAPVTGFVRSPAGTRTIAFLNDTAWPQSGATVTIDAVRPASTLYGFAEQRTKVATLPLGGHAPWEDDDV